LSRRRLLAALLALGGAAACTSEPPDTCEFHANGPWVVFASALGGQWDIALVRQDGKCRMQLSNDAAFDVNPSYGRGVVAYESDRAPFTSIWLNWPASNVERRLDLGDLRAMSPSFSPDGATLVFEGKQATETSTSAIYLVPVTGGTPTPLAPEATPHANGGPAFSPDGQKVYFISNRSGAYEVWEVATAGGDPVQITSGSHIQGRPAVSPDGRTLAFTRLVTSTSTEVVLHDLATGSTTPLGIANASEPAFSRAGDSLAVRVSLGYQPTLVRVDLHTGQTTALTSGGPDGTPAFAPPRQPWRSLDDVFPPPPGS
jgi:dipeptidyl aminopeptidase/acylaminoacyl peptidase